jgi:hypothetical protein
MGRFHDGGSAGSADRAGSAPKPPTGSERPKGLHRANRTTTR